MRDSKSNPESAKAAAGTCDAKRPWWNLIKVRRATGPALLRFQRHAPLAVSDRQIKLECGFKMDFLVSLRPVDPAQPGATPVPSASSAPEPDGDRRFSAVKKTPAAYPPEPEAEPTIPAVRTPCYSAS